MCIEVELLDHHYRTEPVVVVVITVRIVEIEQAGIATIIPIAPAFEERIIRVREVRVLQLNPYILYIHKTI